MAFVRVYLIFCQNDLSRLSCYAWNDHQKLPSVRILMKYATELEEELSCSRGDLVKILFMDYEQQRLLVYKAAPMNSSEAEGWIPSHVVGLGKEIFKIEPSKNYLSTGEECKDKQKQKIKTLRKRSRSPGAGKQPSNWKKALSFKIRDLSNSMMDPVFVSVPIDQYACLGDEVLITCEVTGKPKPNIFWRAPDGHLALPTDKTDWNEEPEGHYDYTIDQIQASDAGVYSCVATSEMGTVEKCARIIVIEEPDPPTQPRVVRHTINSVTLHWEAPANDGNGRIEGYCIEGSTLSTANWSEVVPFVATTKTSLNNLAEGQIHIFRIRAYNAAGIGCASKVSEPIDIPLADTNNPLPGQLWKQHFSDLYVELSVHSRFQFGKTVSCRSQIDPDTKIRLMALKHQTKAEKKVIILCKCVHTNILQAGDFFEYGRYFGIVFKLSDERPFFDHLCTQTHIPEFHIMSFAKQILQAVTCMQENGIIHLNLKPESLLITSEAVVKLCRFEDAIRITSLQLLEDFIVTDDVIEFLPFEIVSNGMVFLTSDTWSVGALLYLMLTGTTPFYSGDVQSIRQNIVSGKNPINQELFQSLSSSSLTLLHVMFMKDPRTRPGAEQCLQCSWLNMLPEEERKFSTEKLKDYLRSREDKCKLSVAGTIEEIE